jgi:hypothetical protein
MAKIPGEDTHGVFARALLKEYGIPRSHLAHVIEELDKIYDSMSFAHNHIYMSLMGTRPSSRTSSLEAYLGMHQTKEPRHRQEAQRRQRERQQEHHAFAEPRYD